MSLKIFDAVADFMHTMKKYIINIILQYSWKQHVKTAFSADCKKECVFTYEER